MDNVLTSEIMDDSRIAFIGAGNMASCLIAGMVATGVSGSRISASSRRLEQRDFLKSNYGINVCANASACVAGADVVVLSVKPKVAQATCIDIYPHLSRDALVISIMAGVSISSLLAWLNPSTPDVGQPVVRCMPNIPASVGLGMSAMFASAAVSLDQKEYAYKLMSSVGRAIWVDDESQFDAVTALSGSGPAYVYLLMEAMIDAGQEMGLSSEMSEILTRQTVLGAASLASDQQRALHELRRQVTSPQGTTEAAVNVLNRNSFKLLLAQALQAAALRSAELARQL